MNSGQRNSTATVNVINTGLFTYFQQPRTRPDCCEVYNTAIILDMLDWCKFYYTTQICYRNVLQIRPNAKTYSNDVEINI